METQIHQLEQEAYTSVLRAFKAQSDAITWVFIHAQSFSQCIFDAVFFSFLVALRI